MRQPDEIGLAPHLRPVAHPVCHSLPVNGQGGRWRSRGAAAWARWRTADPLPGAFLVLSLVVWGARGLQAPLARDAALYLYAGQQVAGGDAPYVGVLNRAGPISHLLPALGIELGRVLDVGDVVGVKVLYLVLLAFAPALVYLLGRDVFGSRLAGAASAAALLSVQVLAVGATGGPEAKLPMMLGLVLTLLLLVRRRWLWAGVATALATLTWQPALFSLLPAALVLALLDPTDVRSRLRSLGSYAAAGAATLGLTVAGFWVAGALDAFIEGYWTVNATHTEQTGAFERPDAVLKSLYGGLGWTVVPMLLGSVLSLGLGLTTVRTRRREPRRAAHVGALAAATAATIAWCGFVAFNRAPDGLPLYPLAALGLGGGVGVLAHLVRRASSRLPRKLLVGAVVGWVVTCAVTTFSVTTGERTRWMDSQRALAEGVFRHLPEDATVFSFEAPQPLVLAHRTSISRFVLFDHGMLDYVEDTWPYGILGYVDWLIEQRPDVLFVHIRNPHAFLQPLMSTYVKVSGAPRRGGSPEWRTYVRDDLDPAVVAAIKADLIAARLTMPDREELLD